MRIIQSIFFFSFLLKNKINCENGELKFLLFWLVVNREEGKGGTYEKLYNSVFIVEKEEKGEEQYKNKTKNKLIKTKKSFPTKESKA
jgi:uncharacterized protein Veg